MRASGAARSPTRSTAPSRRRARGSCACRLAAPLTDPAAIARRLDAVALFVADAAARADVRAQLAAAPDLARSLARIVLGRGGPRDLAAIRDGLDAAAALAARLGALGEVPEEIAAAANALAAPDAAIAAALAAALADELPYMKRDGGFVRAGYDTSARRDARACAMNRAAWSPRCRRATPTRPACAR